MFKKRHFLVILIAILSVVCCIRLYNATDISYADSSNTSVIYPDMNKYLFLESPSLLAIRGDIVAVYDNATNKILTAGSEHNEYNISLADDDKITKLAFANNTLYYLTKQNKLHDVFNDIDVTLNSIIAIDMCSYNDVLYIYNSLVSVYSYDGTEFLEHYDSTFKIIQSSSFTATDATAYFYNDGAIYTLDYTTNTVTKTECAENILGLYIFENELYILSNKDFIKFSDGTKTTLDFDILALSTDGTNIGILDNINKCINKLDNTFSLIDIYGCSSNFSGWFNNPQYVVATKNSVIVYDKNNNRLQEIGVDSIKNIQLSSDYDYFTANDNYYVLSKGSNITFINNGNETSINTGLDIKALAIFDSTLFVFDKSTMGIYTCALDNTEKSFNNFVYSPVNIQKLIAKSSDVLYAKTQDGIYYFTKLSGTKCVQSENIVSFDVDYTGNILALEKVNDKYFEVKYDASFSGYTKSQEIELTGNYVFNDFLIVDGNAAYSLDSDKNLLIKIDGISFSTDETFVPSSIDERPKEVLSFKKSQIGTVVYTFTNNFTKISDIVDAGSTVAILSENENCYFVLTENGKTGYIGKSGISDVSPSTLDGRVTALFDTIGVYTLPSTEYSECTIFDKTQIFNLVDDACGFNLNGDWVKVSYTNENNEIIYGYVLKSRLMTYIEAQQTEDNETTVKVKSSRVGEVIIGYAMADEKSAAVFSIADGTKVKIVGEFDENSKFTLVEHGGVQGYILTKNIQIDNGLTNGQIAAIAISAITFSITIVYLIVSRRRKKLNN